MWFMIGSLSFQMHFSGIRVVWRTFGRHEGSQLWIVFLLYQACERKKVADEWMASLRIKVFVECWAFGKFKIIS